MELFQEIDGKLYATARAYIVDAPEDMPRGMASEIDRSKYNPSFLWIAGRYVQANAVNKNGYYWTYDDIKSGESSIMHSPMNVLHQWDRPVGTFVETKIVHREDAASAADMLPEIQALAVLWASSFPAIAKEVKEAHASKQLWFSMECLAESQQCRTCDKISPFLSAGAATCEHLAESKVAGERRFINPTFLGGALIYGSAKPAWQDADVTDVAQALVEQFARRGELDVTHWQAAMALVVANGP